MSLPKMKLSGDMCAVCGQRIELIEDDDSDSELKEKTFRLNCKHLYPRKGLCCLEILKKSCIFNYFYLFIGICLCTIGHSFHCFD